jgi:alkaline phosphatase D
LGLFSVFRTHGTAICKNKIPSKPVLMEFNTKITHQPSINRSVVLFCAMKHFLTSVLLVLSFSSFSQTDFRIGFGSCSQQDSEEQPWNDIIASKPDIWIWGGDNIYGDSHSPGILEAKYTLQKNRGTYQQLVKTCPVTGTWDDHDYGSNDGGAFFSIKKESKKLAANFLGFSNDNPVWQHEGIYNSTFVEKKGVQIKIINVDTRYFRDTVYKEVYTDTLTGKQVSYYERNPTGDVLGEQQWKWLKEELRKTTAALTIINSSIQVIPEEHRFEKWSNFPTAHKRLYDLLQRYPQKKVIIISGDRHIAELSRRNFPGLPYPLYDFTSSGLTHTWSEVWDEKNTYRVGKLIIEKNFGLMDITITNNHVHVVFSVMGKNGIVYQKHETDL